MKMSKKYQKAISNYDPKKIYTLSEACELVKNTSTTKFNSSVDVSLKLNLNNADPSLLRTSISLPNGIGKEFKVLALCSGDQEKEAKSLGIDYVGGADMLEKIKKGWLDFDVIVTSQEFMMELGKFAKILGPKGLMPNVKSGTVTSDVAKTALDFKKGKFTFKPDKEGNANISVGKVSFEPAKLVENIEAFIQILKSKKPQQAKSNYFGNFVISTTMGPSIKVELPKME